MGDPQRPSTPLPAVGTPQPSTGRARQRLRTRQALVRAALALTEGGRRPSMAEVAEAAMVSRATAYRYFASVEALVSDAFFEQAVPALSDVFRPGDDPERAAAVAAERINGLLLDDPVGLHVIERSFMQVWLDNPPERRPPRPGRRMPFIQAVVNALSDRLGPQDRERLRLALALVMGSEAAITLLDVADASRESGLAASAWAAQALVRQALVEAAGGGG